MRRPPTAAQRLALTLAALTLGSLAGCGPRNKIGDRLLGRDSITNAGPHVSGQNPAPPP